MRTEKVIIPLATFNRLSQVEVDAIHLREKIVELEKQIEDLKSDARVGQELIAALSGYTHDRSGLARHLRGIVRR